MPVMMMNENQSALWTKLASFEIDEPGATYPFSRKLSEKNGWTPEFTRRAIDEYRKFVFLCFSAGHPCSPSDPVDEVWHLHLTYTVSYWERLVKEVLPGALHHDPSQGGAAEDEKYSSMYRDTLRSYRRVFGTEPPTDIWPPSGSFAPEPVVAAQAKDKRRPVRWIAPAFLVIALGSFLGCATDSGPDGRTAQSSDLMAQLLPFGLAVAIFGIVFTAAVAAALRPTGKRRTPDTSDSFVNFGSDGPTDSGSHSSSHGPSGSHDSGGHDSGGHDGGGHSGGHGCGGHGCGGHGCGGHGCGSGH